MDKKKLITVDVELDFGGRTQGTDGIDKGVPLLLKTFAEFNIKALFFISTEIMETRLGIVMDIKNEGHEIGCHGHFHVVFKDWWRQHQNMIISQDLLSGLVEQEYFHWRAPKFSHVFHNQEYSDPKYHIGLLKSLWLCQKPQKGEILYLHPFDIITTNKRSPGIFCKVWYIRPKEAYELLRRYLSENLFN